MSCNCFVPVWAQDESDRGEKEHSRLVSIRIAAVKLLLPLNGTCECLEATEAKEDNIMRMHCIFLKYIKL